MVLVNRLDGMACPVDWLVGNNIVNVPLLSQSVSRAFYVLCSTIRSSWALFENPNPFQLSVGCDPFRAAHSYDVAQHLPFKARSKPFPQTQQAISSSRYQPLFCHEVRHHRFVDIHLERPVRLLDGCIDQTQLPSVPVEFRCHL